MVIGKYYVIEISAPQNTTYVYFSYITYIIF